MKPIFFVLQDFDEGGVQRVTLKLLNKFAEDHDYVSVIILKGEGLLKRYLRQNVKVILLNNSKVLTSIVDLFKIMRNEEKSNFISAIVQVNIVVALLNVLLCKKHNHILTEHTHSTLAQKNAQRMNLKVSYFLQPLFYPLASKILCVSTGIANDLMSRVPFIRKKISIVSNPVIDSNFKTMSLEQPLDIFLDFINGKKVVLGVGRLVSMKDFHLLIDSFEIVKKNNSDAVLVIIGDGPLLQSLKEHAVNLSLSNSVMFLGHIKNPLPYFKKSDVFVLTSKYEGFGLVLVEALALSKSIVSVNCECGPREIISDISTLVDSRDSHEIGSAIIHSLNKPDCNIKMRRKADEFQVNVIANNYYKEFI